MLITKVRPKRIMFEPEEERRDDPTWHQILGASMGMTPDEATIILAAAAELALLRQTTVLTELRRFTAIER